MTGKARPTMIRGGRKASKEFPRALTPDEKKKLNFFGAFINEQINVTRTNLVDSFFEAMVTDAAEKGCVSVPAYMNKLEWSGKYNAEKRDWEGGIVGSDLSPGDREIAEKAMEEGDQSILENYFERGRRRIDALQQHITDLQEKKMRGHTFSVSRTLWERPDSVIV